MTNRVAGVRELVSAGTSLYALDEPAIRALRPVKAANAPRPRVAMIEWSNPIFAGGHWVPEMISRASGADMLAAAGEHSKVVAMEVLAAAAPEIVLVAPCGYGVDRATEEARRISLSSTSGLPRSPAAPRRPASATTR